MILSDFFARLTFARTLMIGFIITAIYYFFFFDSGGPQVLAITATRAKIEKLQKDVQDVQIKLDRAQEFQEATRQLGQSINRLLEFIPSGFRINDFMKTLSTEARISGLQIKKLVPTPNVNAYKIPEFAELGVTIELRGQFSQVLKFMSALTQKKQIFVYESLKMMQDTSGGAETGIVIVVADIRAYDYIGANQSASY